MCFYSMDSMWDEAISQFAESISVFMSLRQSKSFGHSSPMILTTMSEHDIDIVRTS